jgi:hypothetical protein
MDKIDRWKLADELTVYQIALLLAGYDPSEFEGEMANLWPDEVTQDIAPFLNAVKNASKSHKIEVNIVIQANSYNGNSIDWYASTVNIGSLADWMRSKNYSDGFFTESANAVDELADPEGEFYAPKLSAAVRAWREVTADPNALSGKSPKRALEVWLRKHANEYGLTSKDGNPNELGIEEICKIANWKPTGGASPTPGAKPGPTNSDKVEDIPEWVRKARPNARRGNPPTRRLKPPTPQLEAPGTDPDDDIPF